MTYVNNTGTTACTAKVTFSESFSVAKSEWSNAGFIINDIVDNANNATVFSHSITGIDSNANITEMLITFTNASQFANTTKTLLFRLKSSNFGYPSGTTKYAKVTAVNATLTGFLCGGCSGGTPYLEISSNTCVSTCASPKYIGLSTIKGKVCATSAECDTEGLTRHDAQLLCRDTCNSSGNGLQRSDLACTSSCASASTFTSSSTAKYCKELDKQMTYDNNTGTTACTAKVTFAESFDVAKSEWSNAGFIINDIVDNTNTSTVFSHSITGIDSNANITEMLITFTNSSQFANTTKTLLFRLKSSNFGYPAGTTKYAKMTAVSDTLANFNCGGCSGGTPYLMLSTTTCVNACPSSKYKGWSAIKGYLCLTPAECDSESLTKDTLQQVCSNTCNSTGSAIIRSDITCSATCPAGDTFVNSVNLRYCQEITKTLIFTDNYATQAGTLLGTLEVSFNVPKSVWTNSGNLLSSIVDDANPGTSFSYTNSGIDGGSDISTFVVNFTAPQQFSVRSYTLRFNLTAVPIGFLAVGDKFAKITTANLTSFEMFTKTVTLVFTDNSANEVNTIVGTFGETFNAGKSGWSDTKLDFIIDTIVDNDNPTTQYAYTLSAITGKTGIISFKIKFSNPGQFIGNIEHLKVNLKSTKDWGVLRSDSKNAKIADPNTLIFPPYATPATDKILISKMTQEKYEAHFTFD